MRDRKFYDRVKNSLLLPLTDGTFKTFDEYLGAAKEKHEKTVYYSTDKAMQAQYISMYHAPKESKSPSSSARLTQHSPHISSSIWTA
jgi:hypothetical protein